MVEATPIRIGLKGLNRDRARRRRRERSFEGGRLSRKWNDLDRGDHVAIRDGPKARQCRDGDRLIDRIDPVDRLGLNDRQPGLSAKRLTRPVNGGEQRRCWPARRLASFRAASFSSMSPGSSRAATTHFTPSRTKSQPSLARENVALLVRNAINPNAMRKDGALGLLDRRWAEFHALRSHCVTAFCAAKRRSLR